MSADAKRKYGSTIASDNSGYIGRVWRPALALAGDSRCRADLVCDYQMTIQEDRN